MGFTATYLYDGTRWVSHDPEEIPAVAEPWMLVSIHDSDICTVMYRPAGPGSGTAYLGYTPRTYFEDETASEPTNVTREADGLAAWWANLHPASNPAMTAARASELLGFLAEDDAPIDEDIEDDALDDADVFVEIKAARFLAALGLPIPQELSD